MEGWAESLEGEFGVPMWVCALVLDGICILGEGEGRDFRSECWGWWACRYRPREAAGAKIQTTC